AGLAVANLGITANAIESRHGILPLLRYDQSPPRLCPHSSVSTAIRTASPFVTCCKIAECGPSAMSGVIPTQPFLVHAEQMRVLVDRREQAVALPLELDAQQVQHVAARQDVVEAVRHL